MISVTGDFFLPTTGTFEGKPCGWAYWPAGSGFEWEAFAGDRWRRGSTFGSEKAVKNAQKALDLLKQAKA